MVRKIQGRNGGTLYLREKGDPAPNKGQHYVSSSAFVAHCRQQHRPKQEAHDDREVLQYLFEMTCDEWRTLQDGGLLTGDKQIEVAGWLDKDHGVENLRKSKERAYGKPAEHIDHTTAGEALNPLAALTAEQLDTIIKALTDGNSDDNTPKQ